MRTSIASATAIDDPVSLRGLPRTQTLFCFNDMAHANIAFPIPTSKIANVLGDEANLVPFVHVRPRQGLRTQAVSFAWLSKLLMPSYLLEEALLKPRESALKFAFECPGKLFSPKNGKAAETLPGSALDSPVSWQACKETMREKPFSKLYSPPSSRACF